MYLLYATTVYNLIYFRSTYFLRANTRHWTKKVLCSRCSVHFLALLPVSRTYVGLFVQRHNSRFPVIIRCLAATQVLLY